MHEIFLGVKGQENALNILSEIAVKNRIPNALLLSGKDGVGKHYSAIQFLKLLNLESSRNIQKNIESLVEPYIKMVFPLPRGKSETNSDTPTSKLNQETIDEIQEKIINKSNNPYAPLKIRNANNVKINSIRSINKMISMSYDDIPYRGIIISDAHKMTIEAQNAFLKNLEEPPEGIIYILLTDKPDQLLTTIKSRCWEIRFAPLDQDSMADILTDNFNIEQEDLKTVLPFAQGSVTEALFLINHNFNEYLQKTILILRYSLAKRYYTAIKEFNKIIENNSKIAYQTIIDLLIIWFNDTVRNKHNINNYKYNEHIETIEKFNIRFRNTEINSIICELEDLRNAPNKNVNLNILVMNVIFVISSIEMKK